jgi:hypothetical protein
MLKLTCKSLFLLCSVASIQGSDSRFKLCPQASDPSSNLYHKVTCTENFEGTEHTYLRLLSRVELSKVSYAMRAVQYARQSALRDYLRCKGESIITDKQIGDGKVHFILVDLKTGVEKLVEHSNDQFPCDLLLQLDIRTHQLKAKTERIESKSDGVYYPTMVFNSISN